MTGDAGRRVRRGRHGATAGPRADRDGEPLPFTQRVWSLVRLVPEGRVISYGGVAALLGQPRAARGVGGALAALPDDTVVPWWRVINRNGEISIKGPMHGAAIQRMLLRREGVRFGRGGRVDWSVFGWSPEPEEIPPELRPADAAPVRGASPADEAAPGGRPERGPSRPGAPGHPLEPVPREGR